MKFENIKVGDTVFAEKEVKYGWRYSKIFYSPEKVARVTKTQFVVESGDRYKKDGAELGNRWRRAYFEGDKVGYTSGRIVTNETEDMESFLLKLKAESKLNGVAEKIRVPENSNLNINVLNSMIEDLEKIKTAIKEAEETNELNKQ